MQLPSRFETSTGYRYGFQNQEKDNELKGEGNSLNYEYRMHDPRVGRFFAVDPMAAKYAYNSPYAFSENVVINAVELEGLEKWVIIDNNMEGSPKEGVWHSMKGTPTGNVENNWIEVINNDDGKQGWVLSTYVKPLIGKTESENEKNGN